MYRIVTISREYGAGGLVIAQKVASTLGWELHDQSVVKHVADLAQVAPEQAAKVDECPSSWMERLSRSVWMGAPDSMTPANPPVFGADRAQQLAAQFIREKAASGNPCVIIGRGAQCILRDRADTLKVFLHAPRAFRARQVRSQYASDDEARHALQSVDRMREAFVRHYFRCDWRDPSIYDLVINTCLGFDLAVRLIFDTVRASQAEPAATDQPKSA